MTNVIPYIKPFKAPCNITKNNIMEYDLVKQKLISVRYKCGKIKWRESYGV